MGFLNLIERANDAITSKRFVKSYALLFPVLCQVEKGEIEVNEAELYQTYFLLSLALIGIKNSDFFFQVEEYLKAMAAIYINDPEPYLFAAKCYRIMKKTLSPVEDQDKYLMAKYLNLAQENINLVLKMDPTHQASIEMAKEIELEKKFLENNKYKFEGDDISFSEYIDPESSLTLTEAQKLFDRFTASWDTDDEQAQFNAASQLMMRGAYLESITVYKRIILDHPDQIGECSNLIGECYFSMGNYEKAVEYYLKAKGSGAVPEGIIEDNIYEAALGDYEKNQKSTLIKKYLYLYPKGKYTGQAKKIIYPITIY